jgi:hypothetical protein
MRKFIIIIVESMLLILLAIYSIFSTMILEDYKDQLINDCVCRR